MLSNVKQLAADKTISDNHVIARVLAGYTDEYEILIRRHNQLLHRSASGILRIEHDIEDVMQEAYIKGYEKLPQFRHEARFSTWLTRILINCALQHLDKSKRTSMVSIDSLSEKDSFYAEIPEADTPFEVTAVRDNLKSAIESAISQLPPKYRVVFILREVEQNSVKETAAIVDISEENVKVRLHRARALLKDMLSAEVNGLELFSLHELRCAHIAICVMDHIQSKTLDYHS